MSGAVTVMPGYTWTSSSDVLNYAKLNQTGNPSMQVAAGGISSRGINFSVMPIPPSTSANLFEDFLQNAPTLGASVGLVGNNRLTRSSSGNNCAVESVDSTATYAGLIRFTDCVDAHGAGYCVVRGAIGQWRLGYGEITVEWKIISPTTLSGVADIYALYIGLGEGGSICSQPTDGVYFAYTNTISSGAWVGMTTASSASTSVVGPTMVVSTAYNLKAVIAAAGTSVEFFVNGTSIGTSATTIPIAALTYICGMNDTDSSAATNVFYADWVRIEQTFSTSR